MHHYFPTTNLPKNGILAVQMWLWSVRYEELRSICIWTTVGHANYASLAVRQLVHYFILELAIRSSKDTASSASSVGWVSCTTKAT